MWILDNGKCCFFNVNSFNAIVIKKIQPVIVIKNVTLCFQRHNLRIGQWKNNKNSKHQHHHKRKLLLTHSLHLVKKKQASKTFNEIRLPSLNTAIKKIGQVSIPRNRASSVSNDSFKNHYITFYGIIKVKDWSKFCL